MGQKSLWGCPMLGQCRALRVPSGRAPLYFLTPPKSHNHMDQTVPITGSLGAVLLDVPQPLSCRFAPSFPEAVAQEQSPRGREG